MPEALAVVLIITVSIVAYVGAVLQARRPIIDHAAERGRALAQQEWLRQRLAIAQRENWDAGMVAEIERQLAMATTELERSFPR